MKPILNAYLLLLLLWSALPSLQTTLPYAGANSRVDVVILDYEFRPARVNVTSGTNVVWTYATNGRDFHTVTSKNSTGGSPIFASTNPNPLSPGQSYNFTFYLPGNYAYFCAVHPTLMNAWVNVTGQPMTPPTSQPPIPSTALLIIAGVGVAAVVAVVSVLLFRHRRVPDPSSNTPSG